MEKKDIFLLPISGSATPRYYLERGLTYSGDTVENLPVSW
jgi:hypothetical protein